MKIAVYPGSFNPFHLGHANVVDQASQAFDLVIIAQGLSPNKPAPAPLIDQPFFKHFVETWVLTTTGRKIQSRMFDCTLAEFAKSCQADVIVRGLRNGHDLDVELSTRQMLSEYFDYFKPFVYFLADVGYRHYSSTAIRELEALAEKTPALKRQLDRMDY